MLDALEVVCKSIEIVAVQLLGLVHFLFAWPRGGIANVPHSKVLLRGYGDFSLARSHN